MNDSINISSVDEKLNKNVGLISLWFNKPKNDASLYLFRSNLNARLYLISNGNDSVRFVFGDPAVTFPIPRLADDQWHYIVLQWNGDKYYIYADGAHLEEVTFVGDSLATSTYLGSFNGVDQYYKGSIDDVRIYDSILTSSQIEQEYVAGLNSLLASNSISQEEYNQRLNILASK